MAADEVRIDELHLRVPGLSQDDGRRLGEEVARQVADQLPTGGRIEELGALSVRLTVPEGTSRDRLAAAIANLILERLR
jgi:hypothetical protein